ncbi:cell wall hydrolase [Phytohalomonas tamaricis]|uniref:cell wall hydrolase n=1 Tax=Phytohalomonas tamaricis TaxID=2081032 RepID=UPI0021D41321|nr:cell wall hydrolase [Phytohalomonas tamaricis]
MRHGRDMRRTRIALSLVTALLSGQTFAADQATRAKIAEQKAEVLEQKAEAGDSPPRAVLITRPGVQAVDPAGEAPLDNAITCLARSIYWETKGKNQTEMAAVANVVMNRLRHEQFPKTVCEVVTQGSEQGRCQFSWWCDGRSDDAQEEAAYTLAKEIARQALNQQLPDRTDDAVYFQNRHASPSWLADFIKTYETDAHAFYKPSAGAKP